MSKPVFQRIHVSQLKVDPKVQRGLDNRRVTKLAREFNPDAAGALVVSQRSDGYYIIDGQHRHAAGVAAGYTGKLNCVVHQNLLIEDEAALFRTLNDSQKVQAVDKFRVRVVEGDKQAVVINEILARQGWQVAQSTSPGNVSAISTIEKIWESAPSLPDAENLVIAVMFTITKAWGRDAAGAHASILSGLGSLYARFGARTDKGVVIGDGGVDIYRAVSVLAKVRPVDVTSKAKSIREGQGGLIGAAVAKHIVGLYNKGIRNNRLPEWSWTR